MAPTPNGTPTADGVFALSLPVLASKRYRINTSEPRFVAKAKRL